MNASNTLKWKRRLDKQELIKPNLPDGRKIILTFTDKGMADYVRLVCRRKGINLADYITDNFEWDEQPALYESRGIEIKLERLCKVRLYRNLPGCSEGKEESPGAVMMITTLRTIIERRRREGKRDLTVTEQSEILTTGFYDEEKYPEKEVNRDGK